MLSYDVVETEQPCIAKGSVLQLPPPQANFRVPKLYFQTLNELSKVLRSNLDTPLTQYKI